jgi:hypothetical protein
VLRLTPLGLRHFRRARRATQEWMTAVLSRLSEADLRRITKGITALRAPFDGTVHRDGHGKRAESPGDIRRVAQATPDHGRQGAAAGGRRPQSTGS